jgi:uncharacterized protein YciI
MPYVLVILRPGAKADDEPLHAESHERFIDSLIERNLVLLGGGFAEATVGDADGAYLLRCGSLEEARELVAADPYVSNDVARASSVVWELVGINPDAIDAAAVIRPQDI